MNVHCLINMVMGPAKTHEYTFIIEMERDCVISRNPNKIQKKKNTNDHKI